MAKNRPKMPISERAKQFAPFAALRGLEEALAARERTPVPRRELAEDAAEALNRTLTRLQPGAVVTVVYYFEREYLQITGVVTKLDPYARELCLGAVRLPFQDIFEITEAPTPV